MFKHNGCYFQQTHDFLDASDHKQEYKPRGGFASYGSPEAEMIITRVREANKRKRVSDHKQCHNKKGEGYEGF